MIPLIKFYKPKYLLYKGLRRILFFYNPILPILIIFISIKALKDYKTIKDLLNI